jgi:cell division protein FtsB
MTQNTAQVPHPSTIRSPQRKNDSPFRRIPLSNLQIVLIALAVVGGRLIIDFGHRILEGQSKVGEQRQLEADIASLTQKQQKLETDKAYFSSATYVEAWAHDQGKMVRDGEILVIPQYDQYTQTGIAVTSPETVRPSPIWSIWWSLFFDGLPPFDTNTTPLTEGIQ